MITYDTCSICGAEGTRYDGPLVGPRDEHDMLVLVPDYDAGGKLTCDACAETAAAHTDRCQQCGRPMNPVDRMMNATCGPCCRANHRRVTGGR